MTETTQKHLIDQLISALDPTYLFALLAILGVFGIMALVGGFLAYKLLKGAAKNHNTKLAAIEQQGRATYNTVNNTGDNRSFGEHLVEFKREVRDKLAVLSDKQESTMAHVSDIHEHVLVNTKQVSTMAISIENIRSESTSRRHDSDARHEDLQQQIDTIRPQLEEMRNLQGG